MKKNIINLILSVVLAIPWAVFSFAVVFGLNDSQEKPGFIIQILFFFVSFPALLLISSHLMVPSTNSSFILVMLFIVNTLFIYSLLWLITGRGKFLPQVAVPHITKKTKKIGIVCVAVILFLVAVFFIAVAYFWIFPRRMHVELF